MSDLRIRRAKYNGQWFTPLQFYTKIELQNISKKKNTLKLKCADGCDLVFKNICHYYNQHGTEVTRQAHFAHKSIARRDACLALRKYSVGGGESDEHYRTKMNIAGQKKLKFIRQCADSDCNKRKRKYIPGNCYTMVEYKVNNRWLVDVAFFDKTTNELKMVVEVKHKHAVDGPKRQWLIDQDFLYFEVGCNMESNTHLIIDSGYIYYCTKQEITPGFEDMWSHMDMSFDAPVCECQLGALKREQERQRIRKLHAEREREKYRRKKEEERRMEERRRENEIWQRKFDALKEKWRKEDENATIIQTACRAYLAKCKAQCIRERSRSAVVVQSVWRCYHARKLVEKIKLNRREMEEQKEIRRIHLLKEAGKRKKRRIQRFKEEIHAHQHATQTDEERLAEIKKQRLRQKQREKRQDMKQIDLQKTTVEYQKMINKNRTAFGLKKRKLQSSMYGFFKKHKT